jgi:methyl-accepting chemotaxis protein
MSLTRSQIAEVKRTWAMCLPIADTAADVFYGRLFTLDPKLKPLFKPDMKEQKRMLMSLLNAAVGMLDDLPALVPVVQQLGRRHVGYGVKEKDYATVGQALLDTLERGLAEAWTPPVKEAWVAVYGVLSKTMISAAR